MTAWATGSVRDRPLTISGNARKAGRVAVQTASRRIAEDIELGRFKRLRMCAYKRGYETELAAIRGAIGSSSAFGKPFRYYQCPYCDMWHLTSSIKDDGSCRDEVEGLAEGADYTLAYENNLNAGTATVRVRGTGWCTGEASKAFKIAPKPIAPAIALSATSYTWNGKAKTPKVTAKAGSKTLKQGTDFAVAYAKGRKNVGKYSVAVTCKGNYQFAAKALSFKVSLKGTKLKKVGGKTYYSAWSAKKSAKTK